jgi:hypothetical protein
VLAPESIEDGAPLSIAVELAAAAGSADGREVAVRARVHDASGTRELAARTSAVAEAWTVRLDLGPARSGLTRVEVECASPGDPTPENDRGTALVRTRGALVVGWLARESERGNAEQLARAWSAEPGLSAVEIDRERLATSLGSLDLLATFDVDPRELAERPLASFVRRGGAWIAFAGRGMLDVLGPGERGDAGELLPLEIDDESDAERDVWLLVDASGSMAGESFAEARNAALELVLHAREQDEVALRFFTDRIGTAASLGRGGGGAEARTRAARALLATQAPSGPTDIVSVLEELVGEREARRRSALVLLVSDGRDQPRNVSVQDRAEVALQRLAESGARLVVIAAGREPELEFLSSLARPEHGSTLAERGAPLAQLLEREVARGRTREGRISASVTGESASGADWMREVARALAHAGGLPEAARCLRTRARPGDSVAARDDQDRPLLALREAVAGRTAVVATLPSADWAPEWLARAPEWAVLVRAMARGTRREDAGPLAARFVAPDIVRIEHAPPDWPSAVRGRLSGGEFEVELAFGVEAHPAFPWGGLRTARWTERPADARSLELSLDLRDGPVALALDLPCAEEYAASPRTLATPPETSAASANAPRARHERLGLAALLAGLFASGCGGALGAVSGARARRAAVQAERTSGR